MGNRLILHIEDNPTHRKMVAEVIGVILGHRVVGVATPSEARQFIADGLTHNPPEVPDVIVSDRRNDFEQGDAAYAIAGHMRDLGVVRPLVVLSSERYQSLPNTGAKSIEVLKPAPADEIADAVANVLGE